MFVNSRPDPGVLVQAQVVSNDAVEGLTRLVWEGPDHPITPAALHAIANLAADNKQAQDALREAGRHSLSSPQFVPQPLQFFVNPESSSVS